MTQMFVQSNSHATPAKKTSDDLPRAAFPPVILLGGESNALSVARRIGKLGVKVHAINSPDTCVRYSRYVNHLSVDTDGQTQEKAWAAYLLGPQTASLRGAVVLACSDAGIQVLARNRDALLKKFILDDSATGPQLEMLDKRKTYQLAREAGVPTPKFWFVDNRAEVVALKDELVFPLIVKPRLSHVFEERFGKKYLFAKDFDSLLGAFEESSAAAMDVMLVEYLPGDDDKLASYFTYIDEDGTALFHYTKRVIRRYPSGMGAGCYHIADRVPEIVQPSLKLLAHVGIRGVANVEFKFDPRDGVPKLIECNARFVGSNALVAASGCDLAKFVYLRLIGRPFPMIDDYQWGLRMWDPIRDYYSFRERQKRGELSLAAWLKSICHRQTMPYFAWSDPMPTMSRLFKPLRKFMGR